MIDKEYKKLIESILNNGLVKDDRTGTGTISLFGYSIKHNMAHGFPIITGKKISFQAVKTELLWILNGRTDLKYLEDNGVKYWRPDYERSGRTDGTLGPVYGKQWRNFNGVDQFANLVHNIKNNPTSRRLILNAWNANDIDEMVLPPCHYGFQIYINNGTMDLLFQQRSADVFLGLPYDIAMYGLLLEMLAKGANLKAGNLIGQLGDAHIYSNHIEQASLYLSRTPTPAPIIETPGICSTLKLPELNEIKLLGYYPLEAIKAPLSVGI